MPIINYRGYEITLTPHAGGLIVAEIVNARSGRCIVEGESRTDYEDAVARCKQNVDLIIECGVDSKC